MISAPIELKTAAISPVAPASRKWARPGVLRARTEVSLISVLTFTIWLACAGVGILGFLMRYEWPRPAPPAPVLETELLNVELTRDPMPADPAPPPPDPSQPPPLLQPLTVPETPPLVAVAEPSPAIAFALPVEGPVRIVSSAEAAPVRAVPAQTAQAPVPRVQSLTYGQGEGRQPAPEYPRQSVREGQEGVVGIRFSVAENGRVLAAETASRSPWPLLNDAALRVVRERWRFQPGPVRVYEVSIRFELTQ